MPDSLTTYYFFNSIDSTQIDLLKHSIDSLTSAIAQPKTQPDNSGWISLWSAIAGGILVIAGQFLVESFKTRHDRRLELQKMLSELVIQRGFLRNLYRELAMYKIHAAYWWYCSQTETNPEFIEVHRQDHLRSQSECRKVEREIGQAIATFLGLLSKFESTLRRAIDFSNELNEIGNLRTRPANDYDEKQTYGEVRTNKVTEDEAQLREEYFQNLVPFDRIITRLRNFV